MTTHTGTCYCGGVNWEVDGSKKMMAVICHCHSCRKRSGVPFYSAQIFPKDTLQFTKGADMVTTSSPPGGKTNLTKFCSSCGCMIMLQDDKMDKIAAGNLETLKFEPAMHFFCSDAQVDLSSLTACDLYQNAPEAMGGDGKTVTVTNESSDVVIMG